MEILKFNTIQDTKIQIKLLKSTFNNYDFSNSNENNINPDYFYASYFVKEAEKLFCCAVLYKNEYLKFKDYNAFAIGNFESVKEQKYVNFLLKNIEIDCKKLKCNYLIGPINGSTWDQYRFNSPENENPFLSEFTHPRFYSDLFENYGFEKIAKYHSKFDQTIPTNQIEILALKKKFENENILIRKISLEKYESELKKLYPFISQAFSKNFLYSPISWNSFLEKYLEIKVLIDPNLVLIAEQQNEIIGFVFTFENLFNKHEKQLVVKTIARKNDKKYKGLGHVIANELLINAKAKQYKSIIHAFMIEDGTSTGVSNNYLGKSYKSYFLYGKEIK